MFVASVITTDPLKSGGLNTIWNYHRPLKSGGLNTIWNYHRPLKSGGLNTIWNYHRPLKISSYLKGNIQHLLYAEQWVSVVYGTKPLFNIGWRAMYVHNMATNGTSVCLYAHRVHCSVTDFRRTLPLQCRHASVATYHLNSVVTEQRCVNVYVSVQPDVLICMSACNRMC
jgi:hypothetical protein